jgi:hypothetical protein
MEEREGMAKARYSSQTGTKIFIGVAVGLLLAVIAFVIFSVMRNTRFTRFKNEIATVSGEVKSKITIDYNGEEKPLTKVEFGRIYKALIFAPSHREFFSGAKEEETLTLRLSNIGDELSTLTITKTDQPYVKATFQSDRSNYTYWFQCDYDYILILAGLKKNSTGA